MITAFFSNMVLAGGCSLMILVGSIGLAVAMERGADQQAVADLVRRFVDAWNRDDATAFVSLFTRDGELVDPDGVVTKTRRGITSLITRDRRELFFGTTIVESTGRILFPERHVAEVTGSYQLCCAKGFLGFTGSSEGTYMLRLTNENEDGRWLVEQARITEPG